jgi:NADPH2:quinone reductase
VTRFGGPEVLHLVELPEPEAGSGELRIRVHAAAVNPADAVLRSGTRAALLGDIPPPYVPGMDAAGTIEQIGDGASTSMKVGDPVMAIVVPHAAHGAYSERVVVPAESVARMPAGATFIEAATLPMNGLTARRALDVLGLTSGQTLAVTGAAGAVGGYAIQLGKADGLFVIADASRDDEQLVKNLGADIVVRRGNDFAKRFRRAFPQGADGLVDGALLNEMMVGAVRDGGRIATVRGFTGDDERGITFHPLSIGAYASERTKHHRLRQQLDRLRQQAEDGQVSLRVAQVFPAQEAPSAHRILEGGGTRGRLVLGF